MSITAVKTLGRLVQDKLRLGDNKRSANLALASRTRELEDENVDLQEKLAAAHSHEQVQEETIQQLVVQNAATHTELADASSELRRVEQELAAQKHQVSEAECKVKKIRSCFLRNKVTVVESTRELSTIKAELTQLDSKLSNSQAELKITQTKLKSAESIINSHIDTINTLTPHLDFRKSLRLRCLLTYRRDKRRQSLTFIEDELIHEANNLVHGADCLFDMQHIVRGHESLYSDHYESIYGIHPKWIGKYRNNAMLTKITNLFGDISTTDGIGATDYQVSEFRQRFERVWKALVRNEAVSDSDIKYLETKHSLLLSSARDTRRRAWRD